MACPFHQHKLHWSYSVFQALRQLPQKPTIIGDYLRSNLIVYHINGKKDSLNKEPTQRKHNCKSMLKVSFEVECNNPPILLSTPYCKQDNIYKCITFKFWNIDYLKTFYNLCEPQNMNKKILVTGLSSTKRGEMNQWFNK